MVVTVITPIGYQVPRVYMCRALREFSQQSVRGIILIQQRKKLKLREVTWPGHRAGKWQSWDLNPDYC